MGRKIRRTKCKTVFESKHRHDLVDCKCGAIFIDGGNDYTRIGGKDYEFVEEETNTKDSKRNIRRN